MIVARAACKLRSPRRPPRCCYVVTTLLQCACCTIYSSHISHTASSPSGGVDRGYGLPALVGLAVARASHTPGHLFTAEQAPTSHRPQAVLQHRRQVHWRHSRHTNNVTLPPLQEAAHSFIHSNVGQFLASDSSCWRLNPAPLAPCHRFLPPSS
jgi:hypothetical protein